MCRPGVKQILKPAYPQTLFAQPTMEALDVRILSGLARLDMDQLDLPLNPPCQEMTAGQLRPVVVANRSWFSSRFDDLVRHACHAPAGEACIHFQRETLSCISIDHAQHNGSLAPQVGRAAWFAQLGTAQTTSFSSRSRFCHLPDPGKPAGKELNPCRILALRPVSRFDDGSGPAWIFSLALG